jgi:AcrR family transcriptional regulator
MASQPSQNQRRSPRQARSRATWEAIVEAAAQILERRGPDGFNTNAVAERAGVSIGTLYQYFPDKHAILLAAARRELGEAARLSCRQGALARALIAMVERVGRLGGGAAAAAIPASPRSAPPRRTRRGPGWASDRVGALRDLLVAVLTPPQPALRPVPIERRRTAHW